MLNIKKDVLPELNLPEGHDNIVLPEQIPVGLTGGQDVIISTNSHQEKSSNTMPPSNNMGATSTIPSNNPLKTLIDWFAFTVLSEAPLEVFELLGMAKESFVHGKGGNGYTESWRNGNIVVYAKGGIPGMGTNVQMTGSGCRQFETAGGDFLRLINDVISSGGHFTRIDAAVDDYKGAIDIDIIGQKLKSWDVVSLFKKGREFCAYDNTGNVGKTVYFGSSSSDIQVRFYDKAKEQGKTDGMIWNRVELQMRNERAGAFAVELAGTLGSGMVNTSTGEINAIPLGALIAGVLKRYINFVEPSLSDANKCRWQISSWWAEFLGDVEKIKLSVEKVIRTFEECVDWVDRQVASTLGMIKTLWGSASFLSFMESVADDGAGRFGERHRAILREAGYVNA